MAEEYKDELPNDTKNFATNELVPMGRSLASYKPISDGPTGTRPAVAWFTCLAKVAFQ